MLAQDQWSGFKSRQPSSQRHGSSFSSTGSRSRIGDFGKCSGRREEDDDEEDDDDDEDDDDEEVLHESPSANNHDLRFGWQGAQSANLSMAPQQGTIRHVEPQSSHNLPIYGGTQGSFNDALLNGGQWGEEVQNSLIFPDTFASNSLPSGLQQTGPNDNITLMGGNFTTHPEHYSYGHLDSGSGSQPHLSAHYPTPNLTGNISASGIRYGTHGVQAGQSVGVGGAPFASCPSPREAAQQQVHAPRKRRRSREQMPSRPNSSHGRPDAHSAAPPTTPDSLISSPERPHGVLHRVSVDAHCTSDQLGDLMRTLVGVTQTIVIKVDR